GRVVAGEGLARHRRPVTGPARDLARGPARLCQALGIDRALNGADLCDPASPLLMRKAAAARSAEGTLIHTGPPAGVRAERHVPGRFWLDGGRTEAACPAPQSWR